MDVYHTIEYPDELLISAVNIPANFKIRMEETLMQGMDIVVASVAAANPKVSDTYRAVPTYGFNSVGAGIVSDWGKWWVLEYDMPPHPIDPKNASYLVFMGKDGELVRTKHVNHPGHVGNHAIEEAMATFEAEIKDALGGSLRNFVVTFGAV